MIIKVQIYSHFVFSLDECRSFGQTKSVEFIQGLPSILPSSYVLKYAHLPWIKSQNYRITLEQNKCKYEHCA